MTKTTAMVAALTLAWLGGCAETSSSEPAPTCNDLRKVAADTITGAAASVVQCTTKADCHFVDYGRFDCVDCLRIVGNDNVRLAIAAKAASIKQTCDAFTESGCKLIPSGCPAGPDLDAMRCEQGQCRYSP